MAGTTVQIEAGIPRVRRRERRNFALLLVILFYLAVWLFTGAHFMADTNVYTQAILRHQNGWGGVDYRLTTGNPFWDFGHVLWRPFGWLCFVLTRPGTPGIVNHNQRAEVLLALFGINFLASIGGVICFFLLARSVIGKEWPALLATVGLFSADAYLDYAHSGNAYVVGLACLIAGMYFSLPGRMPEGMPERVSEGAWVRALSAFSAAVMFALAVLFWFPYVFVLPAAMAAPLLLYGRERRRLRLAMLTLAACVVVGLAVYGSAIAIAGIRSSVDLRDWILSSGHGQIQPGGFRAAARLAFSVPRSFVNMDRDGMWLKRYLIHDPYAPVTIRNLFRLSLWKVVLFYATASVVCFELLRSQRGRILLFLLAATVLPIFIFALFIFEAGSIERYLPLYPLIFLALGYVLASQQASRASKALLAVALAAMFAVNVNAMRRGTLEQTKDKAVARIHDLVPLLGPNSLVLAVNEQDSLAQFRQNFPMDAINLNGDWRSYDVLEINTERLSTWREDLAKRVLGTWRRGGDVWLPMRFLSIRPDPDWNWVEGDDQRIRWTDLPNFFSGFETGPAVGGPDGFVLLRDSPQNRKRLAQPVSLRRAAKVKGP